MRCLGSSRSAYEISGIFLQGIGFLQGNPAFSGCRRDTFFSAGFHIFNTKACKCEELYRAGIYDLQDRKSVV